MGISRDSRHKRRLTGGKRAIHQKKRCFEMGRPSANTKLSKTKIVREVRTRGGNRKYRALKLSEGNFNWQSELVTRKTKIINVVYNSTNNELVRTNTLTKNTIVTIDATPFFNFYTKHYFGVENAKDKDGKLEEESKYKNFENKEDYKNLKELKMKKSEKKCLKRRLEGKVDQKIMDQLFKGVMYACISSRPGQSGRADGYILEGKELEFYMKKLIKNK